MSAQSFTADSVYAEYTADQLAVCDRMEADYNRDRCAIRAMTDENAGHTVSRMPDDMLVSLAKSYRRHIEDIDDGSRNAAKGERKGTEIQLRDIAREQEYRAALAESWLATFWGTHDYTAYAGRGGLAAVAHHDAPRISYELARLLDLRNWRDGEPHVIDWDAAQAVAA